MVAVVTGGSSGIGWATAQLLGSRGARVAVLDLRPPPAPGTVHHLATDVTDRRSVADAVAQTLAVLGALDVVVNSAGISAVGTVEDNSDEEWRRVLDVNLLGTARVSAAALPALRACGRGSIVNVGSVVATHGVPRRALYAATKGAVHALTLAMAADHLADGVRVNCVHPGTTETPWVTGLLARAADPAAEREALERRQPTGRLVTPQEVAHAVAFLASPLSGSVTGAALAVDGGIAGIRFT